MNKKIKVLLSRFFYQTDLDFISKYVPEVIFLNTTQFDNAHLISVCVDGVDVILGPPPEDEVLKKIHQQLSFIQIPWAGVENIFFDDCSKYSITVVNSHGNAPAVAEMALSLLLSTLKSIPYHDKELRKGNWHRPGDEKGFFPPRMLNGLTIGYFGYGQINQFLDKLLSGFNLNRIAYVSKPKSDTKNGISFLSGTQFDKFIIEADIVIIGAPLTENTINKFDMNVFVKMKSSSILINVSRGKVVNEKDLYSALNKKLIFGAGLDTWYKYPCSGQSVTSPSGYDFSLLDNVVMSPHRSGFVADDFPHLHDVVSNLKSYLNDGELLNVINIKEGY